MADATSVTTQQNAISAYAQPYVENLLGKAQALTNEPYQTYPGQRTADFTGRHWSGVDGFILTVIAQLG